MPSKDPVFSRCCRCCCFRRPRPIVIRHASALVPSCITDENDRSKQRSVKQIRCRSTHLEESSVHKSNAAALTEACFFTIEKNSSLRRLIVYASSNRSDGVRARRVREVTTPLSLCIKKRLPSTEVTVARWNSAKALRSHAPIRKAEPLHKLVIDRSSDRSSEQLC